jgi:hypothetical protein
MKDDCYHAVRCVKCGYMLSWEEIRFLMEETVRNPEAERTAA